MRTLGMIVAAGFFVLTVGCGGGSDNGGSAGGRTGANGGQCPASSSGQTCTGEEAYQTCVMNACGTQYKTCFGNNYAKGDFTGGLCADFIACEMKCPCDATKTTCEGACTSALMTTTAGQTCMTSLLALSNCVSGSGCTAPVCTTTTNTNTNTNTSTSTGCAAAQACCTAMGAGAGGATLAQQCQTALAGQTEAICIQVVDAYRSAGLCP